MIEIKHDNEGVLLPPQLNVTSQGVVPTEVQVFRSVP